MDGQPQYVRITIDQLARLVRELSRREVLDDVRSSITPQPPGTLAIGNAVNQQVLPANKFRFALAVSASGQVVTVSFGPDGNKNLAGYILQTTSAPITLYWDEIGNAITSEVRATGAALGATIGWQEFTTGFPLDGTPP